MKRHVLRFEQASFLVVVMLTAFLMISCIPRNPNTPPVADFKLVESSATELRQLHFDSSTSTDKEDSTDKLIVRWDFNGDGVWEIDYSANKKANEIVNHLYNVAGTTTVVVEVKDSKGLTSRKEKEIQINLAPPQSLYLESFSDNEITIVWNDMSTSEDSYRVSLNDNPLAQLPANTENHTFELDKSATQTISVYCTKGAMESNKTELVIGMNLSESTTVFEEVSITLPASHVGGEVRIEVSQQTPELPEGCNPLSSIYDIDIELSDDATFFPIELAFDPSYEPSNGSDMMPLILHFDSDSGIWIPMMTSIGEDSNLVTYTSSFSEFVLAEVPANSAILNVKIVDFDTASRGFTFVNNPLSMVDADNKMTPYNYSAEEIQEVGGGFCYGMSVVSAATYINNLPRDPYFEFDNDDLLGYLIISRDGKPLLHFDRTLQAFNHLTSCGPIIRLVWGEFTKQYLAKLEVTWRIIFSAHRITQTLKPMSNSFEISEALAILSALRIPVAISLRPKELMLGEAHSVLAYGFKIVLGGIDFLIYDPNYPFEEKELSIRQSYIEGEYGEDYEWFFAQSVEIFAKSVLLGDALEDMIEEAYAPRFKGLYYTPEDGIVHLSLWNHNRPDNHNTPLLEVLKKENGGSYGTLRSYMNLDTTQTFVDEDVSQLNTYTYKLSRSDGKTSDEYSIFARDMTIVPSDGSFISPDATLTINVTDSLGLDNIRAYTVVNYSQYPYVLIDGKRENGNIEVGADLLRNWFGGNNDSLQLMIVGDCEDGFIVREVTYFPSDNASPTVTKVSGPSEVVSETSSTFTWSGSDSDGTITKYEYKKDEGSWVSNGTSTSYTWSGYSEGDHKFEVRAQDNDEQYSNVVTWSFSYSALIPGEYPKDGLIAYWGFNQGIVDGKVIDESVNGHDGTVMNNPEIVDGILGNGMRFHGKNYTGTEGDHVLLPDLGLSSRNSFTISLWANEVNTIYEHWGEAFIFNGGDSWIGIGYLDETLTFSAGYWKNCLELPYEQEYRNKFMHYCLVFEDGMLKAYINGQLTGEKEQELEVSRDEFGLAIHWWDSGEGLVSTRFGGILDEVLIYNRALSSEEVYSLYSIPIS